MLEFGCLNLLEQLESFRNENGDKIPIPLNEASRGQEIQRLIHLKQRRKKLENVKCDLEKKIAHAERSVEPEEDHPASKGKLEELEAVLSCYRVTGLSLCSQKDNKFILHFDNNYKSKFYESYYVELELESDSNFCIKQHTLPYFIPVQSLAEPPVSADISEFVTAVGDYLYAYVIRREEVMETKEIWKHCNSFKLTYTESMDYVEIVVIDDDRFPVSLKICVHYDDLLQGIPSKVKVITQTDDEEEELPELFQEKQILNWRLLLQSKRLSEAMSIIHQSVIVYIDSYSSKEDRMVS